MFKYFLLVISLSSTIAIADTAKEVTWFRESAERKAITYQTLTAANATINTKVKQEKLRPHTWGIILDIDETALDNSEWNRLHAARNPITWDMFAAQAKSQAIPGMAVFTHHIHDLGGYVNFVSNRKNLLQTPTEKNLQEQHIYFDQVLLDTSNQGTSFTNKNPRFIAIQQGKTPSHLPPQHIVAWLGDNIQDFPNITQKDFNASQYPLFGKIFFILPNPMYGSWWNS